MVFPFMFTPEQAARELMELNRRLSGALTTLGNLGKIDVGVSVKEALYREDKVVLYRFKPRVERLQPTPLLIVYALVNRPYMMDLQEDRSLIKGLLEAGVDVYLIDWGYPDAADRYITLDDYINGHLRRSVDYICARHGLDKISLLGVCQGGTFSLCFSALHPERVQNLITMVTPVDFHAGDNLLSQWFSVLDVDLLVDTLGVVPGELLNWVFLSLKPFRLTGQKYVDLVDIIDDAEKMRNFLRMEKWIFDSPNQAGEAFRQFIKDFFQQNHLIQGEVLIGERRVDLKRVTMPVYNIFATADHLVPPPASIALKDYVGSNDYSTLAFQGGHIGIYVSGKAQATIPPAIAKWLSQRL
jgi:poly(R)-hydroxyalkanoic acid synthase, class III, PhaC subunit